MSAYLQLFNEQQKNALLKTRAAERKLGECVDLPSSTDVATAIAASSARFVLLGIPEDIGVRANLGLGGAHTAWIPALQSLLNIQSTTAFLGNELLVLGSVDCAEWMHAAEAASVPVLRDIVAQIDTHIFPLIQTIVAAGKIPIVVGGGHNNAYPIIKGVSLGLQQAINCINMDAHSDYRIMEGRHSGNGFRYARHEGYLNRYALVGLHENYNSAAVVADMHADANIAFSFYEDIFIRQRMSYTTALQEAQAHAFGAPTGIELDLDCIEHTLSSASSPSGMTVLQARQYVSYMAQHADCRYIHLTEGAAQLDNGQQSSSIGKLIAYLITDFIKSFPA